MKRSLFKRVGYDWLRVVSRLVGVTLFGFRVFGRKNVPRQGAVLVCANHQSLFDPLIIGLTIDRRLNYLARKTLFRFAPFRGIIEFLDAIPIDREGLGMAGLKECLRRLKKEEMVLIFPEGTRTHDGDVGPLQPGFVALARRSNVSVLPIGIDGAFEAWPRTGRYPRLATIHVQIGEPLSPDQVQQLDNAELIAEVERRIRECSLKAKKGRKGNR
jgi:1-acyl-sn-glycerol-3-phosphate acyltransferase